MKTKARTLGFSEDTVEGLVVCMRWGLKVWPDLELRLKAETTLWREDWERPLTLSALRRSVPTVKDVGQEEHPLITDSWLDALRKGRWADEDVLPLYPARSKSDLAIRRTRWGDILRLRRRSEPLWRKTENMLRKLAGWDYITVLNFMIADELLSTEDWDWWAWWSSLSAFNGGIQHFILVAKYVNDQCKKHRVSGFDFWRVAESSGLVGYRNLPFPGFDKMKEARALAEGGGDHGFIGSAGDRLAVFERIARRELQATVTPNSGYLPFDDWVDKGDWATAGSSSIGRLEFTANGDKGHVKARKNFVADVVDLRAEARHARLTDSQLNNALVKSELGKLRIAVAGDIHTYWKMTWLLEQCGHSYLQWSGNTLEETFRQQTDRMGSMVHTASVHWNLPFDYASFDHQPSTAELKVIAKILLEQCRLGVPQSGLAEFDDIAKNVLASFDHSWLTCRDGEKFDKWKVKGGVMSGLRWTTVLGNAWNTVMTAWARETVVAATGFDPVVDRWIRGDDSAIVCDSYVSTLLMRLAYDLVGAIGSDGKFGIHHGSTEFLRLWYDDAGVRGYPARAIPGLTQRKPWSSKPWEEEATMSAVFDVCRTLKRRGLDARGVDLFWSSVKRGWSSRRHCSQSWLSVPTALGGLGIEPWDGVTLPDRSWPKAELSHFKITNLNGWRASTLSSIPVLVEAEVTTDESQAMAEAMVKDCLVQDDIPSVNSRLRDEASYPSGATWHKIQPPRVTAHLINRSALARRILYTCDWSREWFGCAHALRARTSGTFRHLMPDLRYLRLLEKVRPHYSAISQLREWYPAFDAELRQLLRSGLSRREAVDWLTGAWTAGPTSQIHSQLTHLISNAVLFCLDGYVGTTKTSKLAISQLVSILSRDFETCLLASPGCKTLYDW